MKKLFIGLFALLSLFTLVACSEEKTPVDPNEFEQNEETFVPDINMWVVGSHWNSWDPTTLGDAQAFVKDENSAGLDTKYTFTLTVTQEMIDAWCGFKFVGAKGWNVQFGMEDIDYSKCNQAFIEMIGDKNEDGKCDAQDKYFFHEGTSNRNNVVVGQPGTLVIEYYPYNFASEEVDGVPYSCKFAVQFTPAA
jgi:hypothetical protein